MNINLNIWSLAALIMAAMLIGFWAGAAGRRRDEAAAEPEAYGSLGLGRRRTGEEYGVEAGEEFHPEVKKRSERKKSPPRKPEGWAIGSPAAGEVSAFDDGIRRGVFIRSSQGQLYAPAAGKIIKLYPTGNAFLMRTEHGIELQLKVGENTEELEGMYFRSRVVQNEIVSKGKLLLEYDVESIVGEGYDPLISLCVEGSGEYQEVAVTEAGSVRNGEDLLWVRE